MADGVVGVVRAAVKEEQAVVAATGTAAGRVGVAPAAAWAATRGMAADRAAKLAVARSEAESGAAAWVGQTVAAVRPEAAAAPLAADSGKGIGVAPTAGGAVPTAWEEASGALVAKVVADSAVRAAATVAGAKVAGGRVEMAAAAHPAAAARVWGSEYVEDTQVRAAGRATAEVAQSVGRRGVGWAAVEVEVTRVPPRRLSTRSGAHTHFRPYCPPR